MATLWLHASTRIGPATVISRPQRIPASTAPTDAPRRLAIMQAIRSRLTGIQTTAGYRTNLGNSVYLGGLAELGDDESAAIIVLAGPASTPDTGSRLNVVSELTFYIQAVAKSTLADPWPVVENALDDIRKAIETSDRTLGGLINAGGELGLQRGDVDAIPRDQGQDVIGLQVEYFGRVSDSWGA